jgi:hypothetical protein
MADLDALHTTYKAARLKYLNIRRDAEEALMAEMVARVKLLEEAAAEPLDRMAKARAAKAAKAAAEVAAVEAEKAIAKRDAAAAVAAGRAA